MILLKACTCSFIYFVLVSRQKWRVLTLSSAQTNCILLGMLCVCVCVCSAVMCMFTSPSTTTANYNRNMSYVLIIVERGSIFGLGSFPHEVKHLVSLIQSS